MGAAPPIRVGREVRHGSENGMAGEGIVLRLGTRGSPLALAQAWEARSRLCAAQGWPEDRVEVVVIKVMGDAIQDRALSEAGGKGLFTNELDLALMARRGLGRRLGRDHRTAPASPCSNRRAANTANR